MRVTLLHGAVEVGEGSHALRIVAVCTPEDAERWHFRDPTVEVPGRPSGEGDCDMAVPTAIDSQSLAPPSGGCACCGNPLPEAMVCLRNRPDVAVCHDCVRWLGRVELEPRNLDRHGDGWEGTREGVGGDQGWPLYLERFAALAGEPG